MINLLLPLLALGLAQEPCDKACRADINDDGVVNIVDLQLFLKDYDGVINENTPRVDLNCDGLETITDYVTLLTFFGTTLSEDACE